MSQPVIVMGANGGIGQSLAERLLSAGHDVVLTSRSLEKLSYSQSYKTAKTVQVDVENEDDISQMIEEADNGEGISGLAYCIGSITLKPFRNASDDAFTAAWDLNLMGAVRSLRAAQNSLRNARGSVVLFSTIAVCQGFPNHTVISAAKGGVEGFVRALAAEWAPHVRVNCIAPSLTDTELASPIVSSETLSASIAAMHPIPRLGLAEDSAAVAEFLLGPASGWITGQVLHVDGGRSSLRVKA